MYFNNIKLKKRGLLCDRARGFTLLEVIITIALAAILGTFMILFIGTSVLRSSDSVNQAINLATAKGAMEKISSSYAGYLATGDWTTFKSNCSTNASCSVLEGCSICFAGKETIAATITVGDQTFVTYFMQ